MGTEKIDEGKCIHCGLHVEENKFTFKDGFGFVGRRHTFLAPIARLLFRYAGSGITGCTKPELQEKTQRSENG